MLTIAEARQVVDAKLESLRPVNEDLVVIESATIEKWFGWVFFYQSRRFIDTGDFSYMLLGNAPLIVNRFDGSISITGTACPIEQYVADYEQSLHPRSA